MASNSWICPFIQTHTKMKWVLPWPIPHPPSSSTEVYSVAFNPANKQTSKQTHATEKNITSSVEVIKILILAVLKKNRVSLPHMPKGERVRLKHNVCFNVSVTL